MNQEAYELRKQYPDLVGGSAIDETKKQTFVMRDLIPVGLLVFLFGSVAWFYGHVKPENKLDILVSQIDLVSFHFDERTGMINQLISDMRNEVAERKKEREKKEAENAESPEKDELYSFERQMKANGFSSNRSDDDRLGKIAQIELSIQSLIKEKPSEYAIKQRFNAMLEFAELSSQIVDGRKLSQYYHHVYESPEEVEEASEEGAEEPLEIKVEDLNIGSETDRLIRRAKKAIKVAEHFRDDLTDTEKKGKELLGVFSGFSMPKRDVELKEVILTEWIEKYEKLLSYWRELKIIQSGQALEVERVGLFKEVFEKEKARHDVAEKLREEQNAERRAKYQAATAERERKRKLEASKSKQAYDKQMNAAKKDKEKFMRELKERVAKDEELKRKKAEARKKINID